MVTNIGIQQVQFRYSDEPDAIVSSSSRVIYQSGDKYYINWIDKASRKEVSPQEGYFIYLITRPVAIKSDSLKDVLQSVVGGIEPGPINIIMSGKK